jgi:hypothetical protein
MWLAFALVPDVALAEWVPTQDGEVWVPPSVGGPPAVNIDVDTTRSVTPRPSAGAPAPVVAPSVDARAASAAPEPRGCETRTYSFDGGKTVNLRAC